MKKSVYSIVLMDDVIREVDKQAYLLGTSRSNLINQILAEHLSCVTPEMRMREIFDSLTGFISSSFTVQEQRSASLLTMKTALEYKYRPTINYKVALDRTPGTYIGDVRVMIRTQNPQLISLFGNFFQWRAEMERDVFLAHGCRDYSSAAGTGFFSRRLIDPGGGCENSGRAISSYLTQLDRHIQLYYSAPGSFPANAAKQEFIAFADQYLL